ncbi:MAG: hypothetical protein KJZ69_09725 [Phycisphaerales bacterium]|nr:hypothetical protein [Phycisphaerales bacterium]
MAIQSRLATGYWMRKVILTAIFFGFGCWGVYDGWVAWPRQAAAWKEYQEFRNLEDKRLASPGETLMGEEYRRWDALRTKYPKAPRERSDLDVSFQQYLIVPVCFGVSALFLITWMISARRRYTYNDDGSLIAPEGAFRADEMTGIDMTRWMSKSIAMLEIAGGPKGGGKAVKLDAWIYAGLEEVIETLNRRFHPEEYRPASDEPPQETADADGADEASHGGDEPADDQSAAGA